MQVNEPRTPLPSIRRCACLLAVIFVMGVVDLQASRVVAQENDELPRRLNSLNLPNPVQVHANVISGGLPEGEAAFGELADRGIKTIISVDGMQPDVETAKKFGLRYVHLPHGYDGVPESRIKELAKAVQTLEGPIYIHCHHGKHRSPAAASVACVAAGLVQPEKAIEILELAGTNQNYVGLYQSARLTRPIPATQLDAFSVDFVEVAEVPPMAQAMVELELTHQHVKLIAESNWRAPEKHPDLDPAHEALLLREHFTELLRTEQVKAEPADFKRLLEESERASRKLERLLSEWYANKGNQPFPPELSIHTKRIADNCIACHERFRDVPHEARDHSLHPSNNNTR